jgi:hypothetical protein
VLLLVVRDQRCEDLEAIVVRRAGLGSPQPLDLLERGLVLLHHPIIPDEAVHRL